MCGWPPPGSLPSRPVAATPPSAGPPAAPWDMPLFSAWLPYCCSFIWRPRQPPGSGMTALSSPCGCWHSPCPLLLRPVPWAATSLPCISRSKCPSFSFRSSSSASAAPFWRCCGWAATAWSTPAAPLLSVCSPRRSFPSWRCCFYCLPPSLAGRAAAAPLCCRLFCALRCRFPSAATPGRRSVPPSTCLSRGGFAFLAAGLRRR